MSKYTKIYKFYDSDDTGFEEYNIIGSDYKKLIEICCKYCKTLSLIITNPQSELFKKLETFEVKKSKNISFEYTHYDKRIGFIKYYKVTPELYNTIIDNTDEIFCWINGWGFSNPEDPTFYREDGSVLFTSTIHDGECTLMVKNEDVSEIVSDPNWLLAKENIQLEDINQGMIQSIGTKRHMQSVDGSLS